MKRGRCGLDVLIQAASAEIGSAGCGSGDGAKCVEFTVVAKDEQDRKAFGGAYRVKFSVAAR